MAKAIYLTRSHSYDHILKLIDEKNYGTVEIGAAWSPSKKIFENFRKIPIFTIIRSLLYSRPIRSDVGTKSLNIHLHSYRNIEFSILFLNFLTLGLLTSPLFKLREGIIILKAKRFSKRGDLVISTDDFPIRNWQMKNYIVEFRGMPNFIQVENFREIFYEEFNLKFKNNDTNTDIDLSQFLLNSQELHSIIVYSTFLKEHIIEYLNFTKPIAICPPSVPKYEFRIQRVSEPRSQQLLFVGRDDPFKGLDFALKLAKMSRIKLIVVGSYSSNYARQLSLLPFVDFRGTMNRSDLFSLMGQTAILLAPSIETFGYSIAEAINFEMNVILSKYAGISEKLITNEHVAVMDNFEIHQWVAEIFKSLQSQNSKCLIQPNSF